MIALVCCYYNPRNYERRYRNYQQCRELWLSQGANLYTIELALGDQPFVLDGENIIQVRSHDVLWQQQRLYTLAIQKHVPKEFDKVVWADVDLLWDDPHWLKQTDNALDVFDVIQPYHMIKFTDQNNNIEEIGYSFSSTFGGHTGGAWAVRREHVEKHGIYDCSIVGGNDTIWAASCLGCWDVTFPRSLAPKLDNDARSWGRGLYEDVKGNIGYLDLTVTHLWHGTYKNRQYGKRHRILRQHNFDPNVDIKINEQGVYVWNSDKPVLHRRVANYFKSRKEDG